MLKQRIDILENAGVISNDVSQYVKEVIDLLSPKFSDKESLMEMFTTHLAMATQRVVENGEVEVLDDVIWQDVLHSPSYEKAVLICDEITKDAPCEFPEGEKRFILMHLCNLNQ